MAERAGKDVIIKVSGSSVPFTKQTMNAESGNLLYLCAQTAYRSFDPEGTFLVYDNNVLTTEPYTIDYIQGGVVFTTNASRTITVSGAYLTMSTVATASSLSVNETCDLLDVTPFGNFYKKRISGMKSASGTITKFEVADSVFQDAILNAEFLILDVYHYSSEKPRRYWVYFDSNELQAAVEGAQNNVLNWQSTQKFDKII